MTLWKLSLDLEVNMDSSHALQCSNAQGVDHRPSRELETGQEYVSTALLLNEVSEKGREV